MLEFAAFLSIFDSKFRVFVFWCCWRCHFGLCEVLMSFCFCFFNNFLAVYRPNSQIIMKIIGRLFDNEFRPCVQITLSCSNVNIHWFQHFLVFCVFASGCFLDSWSVKTSNLKESVWTHHQSHCSLCADSWVRKRTVYQLQIVSSRFDYTLTKTSAQRNHSDETHCLFRADCLSALCSVGQLSVLISGVCCRSEERTELYFIL